MVAEMIGVEAYRPGGTYFGGPNPYGAWNPTVAGTGFVGTNSTIGARLAGYPVGGYPGTFGVVPNLGMGMTQSTTYNPQLANKNEERFLKGQVEDLQFLIEHEFDEKEFLQQFNEFKERYKKRATYRQMLNSEIYELTSSGMDEQTARKVAEENCEEQIFDTLAAAYETYSGGKNFRDEIKSKFKCADQGYINFIRQLQGKSKLYK